MRIKFRSLLLIGTETNNDDDIFRLSQGHLCLKSQSQFHSVSISFHDYCYCYKVSISFPVPVLVPVLRNLAVEQLKSK